MKLHTLAPALALLLFVGCDPIPATAPQPHPAMGAVDPGAGAEAPAVTAAPPLFGIGGGEDDPLTHVWFEAPAGMVAARVQVAVDRVAPVGLNFFALQVNFDNGTWAHGGLQDLDGPDGTRRRVANWGGLVDRGGGTADYDEEDDRADLERIQNAPEGEHVAPYAWGTDVVYELSVERGEQVTLPPGTYRLIPGRPEVPIDHARTLWQWRFTARPVDGGGAAYVAVLYDTAAAIQGFVVWNESGYGSTSEMQHTRWWAPAYREPGADADATPSKWGRF